MFDAVRNNKRIVQIFLALITLPFAFWGVDSYIRNDGAGSDLANVGGGKITQQQFAQAMREQIDQMRSRLGPNFNQAMFETPEARRAMLDQLINQRLLLEEAKRLRLTTGDDQLRQIIAAVPSLQENGKFSIEKYEAMIRAQGYNQAGFEARLRQDLTVQQIAGTVGESAVTSRVAAGAFLSALAEQRQVAEYRFKPEEFQAQVKIADEELLKQYEATKKDYEEPEQVRAAFVVLSQDALKAQTAVSAEEIRKWYDGHLDRYQQPEERRASHILLLAEAKAAADVKAKAKARAEDILKQIKAKPDSFGALAKQNSQDPGSAEKNGDLGFFSRGAMVKPFEDAVFSLKEGEVSGIVESDFGFHIIKLTGINPGKQKALDEVRSEIESELKQQGVLRKYAEAAEVFANMAYEQSDSLKPIAEKFKLTVQETGWLVKGRPVAQPGSPFANGKLMASLFTDDAVKNKRNSEAVEIAPNTLAAARVIEHKPAALRPFDAVKAEVRARLLRKEAVALAVKAGEAKLADYTAGKDGGVGFGGPKPVSRMNPGGVALGAVQAIFKADQAKLPGYVGTALPEGGYALYKVIAVDAAVPIEERKAEALRAEFANLMAQEEFNAYLASLRSRHKVDINKAALEVKQAL